MEAHSELYSYFLKHPHVCTDSRRVEEGDLFFALSGPRFDGNAFALSALEKGAAYAVVSDKELAEGDDRCIYVPDTLAALQDLARTHRDRFDIPVIAITGTNGKTTTKELTRAVLSRKYRLLATEGNLNNHIGVPLTLLRLTEEHQMALIEMGASAPGEIAFLCSIAHPTAGLITNIGKAHLEGFGSVEGILRTKSELPDYLQAHGGFYFLNVDDHRLFKKWADFASLRYGIDPEREPDVTCDLLRDHPYLEVALRDGAESVPAATRLTGRYNYQNILAAAAVGMHYGVSLVQAKAAIEAYRPSNSRSQVIEWREGVTVIMDAYNANPSSMMAALTNLAALEAPHKAAILGDMLELGKASEAEHAAIVGWLREHPDIKAVLCGREFVRAADGAYPAYETAEELAARLSALPLPSGACLLIKGSRGIALEKVLEALEKIYN